MPARNSFERIFANDVNRSGECWIWTGPKNQAGFGVVTIDGVSTMANRFFYERFNGPIPEGKHLWATCRCRACVNPAHFEAITPVEVIRRSDSPSGINFRKTHCIRGHELAGANLLNRKNGHRGCRTCADAAWKRFQMRKKAKGGSRADSTKG